MSETPGLTELNNILPNNSSNNSLLFPGLENETNLNSNFNEAGGAIAEIDANNSDLETAFTADNSGLEFEQFLFAETQNITSAAAPPPLDTRSASQVDADPLIGASEGDNLVGELAEFDSNTSLPPLFLESTDIPENEIESEKIARQQKVAIDFSLLEKNADKTLRINLFEDVAINVEFDSVTNSNDGESWIRTGKVIGEENSRVILISSKDGTRVLSEIRIDYEDENKDDKFYEIRSLDDGIHVVNELNLPAFPHCSVCGGSHVTTEHGNGDRLNLEDAINNDGSFDSVFSPLINAESNNNQNFSDSGDENLYKYEFTYYYSGNQNNTNKDYYSGYVFAPEGTYEVDKYFDFNSDENQAGANGKYLITKTEVADNNNNNAAGEVYVELYYDVESANSYTPYYNSGGFVSGKDGLGSEEDFIGTSFSSEENGILLLDNGYFGGDDAVANIVANAPAPLTGNPQLDGLLAQSKWDTEETQTVTYSFITSQTADSYYGRETVSEPNNGVKQNIRQIFQMFEQYIDIEFQEVVDTVNSYGQMRIMFSDAPSSAYTYFPPDDHVHQVSGDVHLLPDFEDDPVNQFSGAPGSYGYMVLIHEISHGLGLKHPGNYSSGERSPFLSPGEDNNTNTVMTYSGLGGSNTNPATPMSYDIQALQYLYGTNTDFKKGNTTYSFDSVYGFSDGSQSLGSADNPMKLTLWDGGGTDTLNFSKLPALELGDSSYDYRIDLTEGGFITTADAYNQHEYIALEDGNQYETSVYGTAIAFNAVIENVVNSAGNDLIYANSAANTFRGYAPGKGVGFDQIIGTDSQDTLDLSGYSAASVTETRSGQDLVIDLGDDGQVRISGYYQNSDRINIQFGGNKPLISIEDVTITEGNNNTKNARFTVSLNKTSNKTVKVDYATADDTAEAGSDYKSRSGTINFAAGQTSKTINVPIIGEKEVEFDETFFVNLTNPSNGITSDRQGVGTIENNDSTDEGPAIFIDDVTITEGNSGTKNAQFTVSLNQESNKNVKVTYSTTESTNNPATPGVDFQEKLGTLTFKPGQTTKKINVRIIGDKDWEVDEQFFVALLNPKNATITDEFGFGLIENNDKNVSLSIEDTTIVESNNGTKQAKLKVSLDSASNQTVTVDYRTADSTATAGSDYRAKTGTLTFKPGQTSKNVKVAVIGDKDIETDEVFWTNIYNATNADIGDIWGMTTIENNDSFPSISVNDITITESNNGTKNAKFTLAMSKRSSESVTVDYETANFTAEAGSDYQQKAGTVTFKPGQKQKTVTVKINGDLQREDDETFSLNLSNASNGTIDDSSGVATIKNNDNFPFVSISDVTIAEGDGGNKNARFAVTLGEASDKTVKVDYATANDTARRGQDYQSKTGTLTFQPGQTRKNITVRVKGDEEFEEDETFFVNLTSLQNAIAADVQGIGTIENDDTEITPVVSIDDVTITEGNSGNKKAKFTVSLSEANNRDVKVEYLTTDSSALAGSDYRKKTGTLTFEAGEISKNIKITVLGDKEVENDEIFWVGIVNPSNATIEDTWGMGKIVDNDE